nr:MAG TPA: hypothetical protein [Caudoviricetes sp.]
MPGEHLGLIQEDLKERFTYSLYVSTMLRRVKKPESLCMKLNIWIALDVRMISIWR